MAEDGDLIGGEGLLAAAIGYQGGRTTVLIAVVERW
jgi:hypothetical protein